MATNLELADACVTQANTLDAKRQALTDGDANIATLQTQSGELRVKSSELITKGVAEAISNAEKVKDGVTAATKIATETSTKISDVKQMVDLTGTLLTFVGSVMSGDLTTACDDAETLVDMVGKLLD